MIKGKKKFKNIYLHFSWCNLYWLVGLGLPIDGGTPRKVNIISRVTNVDINKAPEIKQYIKRCRLSRIWWYIEGRGSKGHRIRTDFSDKFILYLDSNSNVMCARYVDKDYYKNGNALKEFE